MKDSDTGGVPSKFGKYPIEISFECEHIRQTHFRKSSYHVTVDVNNALFPSLHQQWKSETITSEHSPAFVDVLKLRAYNMDHSQKIARNTWLRVRVWGRRKCIATSVLRLSDVLWWRHMRIPNANATIIIRADAYAVPVALSNAQLSIDVNLTRGRQPLFYQVLRATDRGQWVPVVRSETRRGRRFNRTAVPLTVLLAGDAHRVLRIRVCRQRATNAVTVAVAQFRLRDLAVCANRSLVVPRLRTADNSVALRVDKIEREKGGLYLDLTVVDVMGYEEVETVSLGPLEDRLEENGVESGSMTPADGTINIVSFETLDVVLGAKRSKNASLRLFGEQSETV